jgi:hypothetical protein
MICLLFCFVGFEEYDVKPTIFTYRELETATQNFHPSMKLGEGGYGAVYKVHTRCNAYLSNNKGCHNKRFMKGVFVTYL